jgi:hypothetical protein
MFCCSAFSNLVEGAGERGIAVLVYTRADEFRFAMQSRAVSILEQDQIVRGLYP